MQGRPQDDDDSPLFGGKLRYVAAAAGGIVLALILLKGGSSGEAQGSLKKQRRSPTTTVVVKPGETVGDLCIRYVGPYTYENLEAIHKLNKDVKDLDLVQPGQELKMPDNRSGIFEPEVSLPSADSPPVVRG